MISYIKICQPIGWEKNLPGSALVPTGGVNSSEPRRKGDEVPQFPPSGAGQCGVECWVLGVAKVLRLLDVPSGK